MENHLRITFDYPVIVMDSETGGLMPEPDIQWKKKKGSKKNPDRIEGIIIKQASPILQISAVKLNQQTLEEEDHFNTLVGPDEGETVEQLLGRCDRKALEVNGLGKRKKELAKAPPLHKAIQNFLYWLPNRYLIAGQNVQFDLNFFNAALDNLNKSDRFIGQPLELLAFSRLYFSLPDTPIVANHKLETIAAALDRKSVV